MLTWTWNQPSSIKQVSVGDAGADSGPTAQVSVELLTPSGQWVAAAAVSDRSVGDAPGAAPYLLASFDQGIEATALRVVIHGEGVVSAMDVHALASTSAKT